MIDTNCFRSNKVRAVFTVQENPPRKLLLTGREAQTLGWLALKSEAGVTAQEVSTWALRLAAYVHLLRHKHGLAIKTIREPHEGGEHARYALTVQVDIEAVQQL